MKPIDYLVIPYIVKKSSPINDNIHFVYVPDHQDQDQIYLTSDEKTALEQAKKLATIFSTDLILVFKCIKVVEATGKCPYVIKEYNDKGELIPVEAFRG